MGDLRFLLLSAPLLMMSVPSARTALHGFSARTADANQFRFAPEARTELHHLWVESTQAKEERVACIGGSVSNGVAFITAIQELQAPTRDSTHVMARRSIEVCRPPQWLGTVHTHIATFQGIPYVTFSADDRDVMALWHHEWKDTGVFCVVYSATAAHCESGEEMSGDPVYAGDDAEDAGLKDGGSPPR